MRQVEERPTRWERGDIRGVLLGELRLPIRPESASAERRFLKIASIAWGIPGVADTTELLGCELVTNAVRYAVTMPGSTLRLLIVRVSRCALRAKRRAPGRVSRGPALFR